MKIALPEDVLALELLHVELQLAGAEPVHGAQFTSLARHAADQNRSAWWCLRSSTLPGLDSQ
jgi:hypothetical protein